MQQDDDETGEDAGAQEEHDGDAVDELHDRASIFVLKIIATENLGSRSSINPTCFRSYI